jgi:hypothetical protein
MRHVTDVVRCQFSSNNLVRIGVNPETHVSGSPLHVHMLCLTDDAQKASYEEMQGRRHFHSGRSGSKMVMELVAQLHGS